MKKDNSGLIVSLISNIYTIPYYLLLIFTFIKDSKYHTTYNQLEECSICWQGFFLIIFGFIPLLISLLLAILGVSNYDKNSSILRKISNICNWICLIIFVLILFYIFSIRRLF